MKAVDLMVQEHRLIERMLRVIEDAAMLLERADAVPAEILSGIFDFLQQYADARHHAKEEEIFFPALLARGLEPAASVIGGLHAQHEQGRALVAEMRRCLAAVQRGERSGSLAFAAAARAYVELLRVHIRLEDHHFVEYAEEFLSPDDDAGIRARMDEVDRAGAASGHFERMVTECEEALLKC